jgi:CheY-like chemotaxis protein
MFFETFFLDTGIGMDEMEISKIFEPWKQANAKSEGMGLGLAIAQDLSRQMSGTIDVFSLGKGKGSTFRLCLPQPKIEPGERKKKISANGSLEPKFNKSVSVPNMSREQRKEKPLLQQLQRKQKGPASSEQKLSHKVLIVEDTSFLQKLLEQQMRRLSFENIFLAASGLEAVSFLEDCSVDIVLTDVMMPGGIDGFELTMLIRRKNLRCKVFAVSALTDLEFHQQGAEVGLDGFLTKPVTLNALKEKLELGGIRMN